MCNGGVGATKKTAEHVLRELGPQAVTDFVGEFIPPLQSSSDGNLRDIVELALVDLHLDFFLNTIAY